MGIVVARAHQVHRAVLSAACWRLSPCTAPGGRLQTTPAWGHPLQPRTDTRCVPKLPSEAFQKLGRHPPTAAPARAIERGAVAKLRPLSCLPACREWGAGDAGQWREASSRWILLDCAGSKGEPSFETLPPGSARWCHACRALEAPHSLTGSRWHRVSFARISMTRSRPAACRVGFSDTGGYGAARTVKEDGMNAIRDTLITQGKGSHSP